MCKWCLCLFPHCSMQRKDVNHNQLKAVGHSASRAPFYKCTEMWRRRCQFSTCDFQRGLQELCVRACVVSETKAERVCKATRVKPRVGSTCIWKGLGSICITCKEALGSTAEVFGFDKAPTNLRLLPWWKWTDRAAMTHDNLSKMKHLSTKIKGIEVYRAQHKPGKTYCVSYAMLY